jgi:hypothetical protein
LLQRKPVVWPEFNGAVLDCGTGGYGTEKIQGFAFETGR